MKKKISIGAIICALFVLGAATLSGCGKDESSSSSNTSVTVKSLATGNSALLMALARQAMPVQMLAGATATDITVDGLKITFVNGIELCTGTYAVDGRCDAQVAVISSPTEVDLSGNVNTQVSFSDTKQVAAGTYTHARIAYQQGYSIKAHWLDGSTYRYTTTGGISSGSSLGTNYDYMPMSKLVPGSSESTLQETTYFASPMVYDGSSALNITILVDPSRVGKFTSTSGFAFEPYYQNIYIAFNDSAPTVETYRLNNQDTFLTLVLGSDGSLIGGRTRGVSFGMQQFLKDWSCTGGVCSFKVGDFGTNVFDQNASGFVRQSVGGTGTITGSGGSIPSSISYERVAR